MRYMNEIWVPKTTMWCVGARRIPHAGQNTNAAIESYHSNLKSILNSTKERFVGRRMDWLVYHPKLIANQPAKTLMRKVCNATLNLHEGHPCA